MSIRFIYFDLGGVLIKDFSENNKWQEMIDSMGVSKENFDKVWNKFKDRICIDVESETIVPIFREELNLNLTKSFSFLAQFIDRFERNSEIDKVLKFLKQKNIKFGILTNAYPRMFSEVQKKGILPDFDFDKIVDSSVVKLQKPDEKIYKLATEISETAPENILFIDNSQNCIEGAKNFGWQTFFYSSKDYKKSSEELLEFLKANL